MERDFGYMDICSGWENSKEKAGRFVTLFFESTEARE